MEPTLAANLSSSALHLSRHFIVSLPVVSFTLVSLSTLLSLRLLVCFSVVFFQ